MDSVRQIESDVRRLPNFTPRTSLSKAYSALPNVDIVGSPAKPDYPEQPIRWKRILASSEVSCIAWGTNFSRWYWHTRTRADGSAEASAVTYQ